jgi:acyl-CoA reductase-like NAD-dependent aldehyde dehydrogenase
LELSCRVFNPVSLILQIEDNKQRFATLESMDQGKPIAEAEADMVRFSSKLPHFVP